MTTRVRDHSAVKEGSTRATNSSKSARPTETVKCLIQRIDRQYAGLLGALAILIVVLSFTAPHFVTLRNATNILQSVSFLGIISLGMTLVIVAAEIDISVGSAMSLYSALLGVLVTHHRWPILAAAFAVIALGALVGAGAGYVRHRFNVPSFIVTLALLSTLAGFAQYLTNASPIAITSGTFAKLGGGTIHDVPIPLLFFLGLFIVFWFVAEKTTFGRSVYAVGGNAEAALIAGLSLRRVRVLVFTMTGLLSAVSAILLSSLIGSGNSGIGTGAEFQVIAAVIVGGTSLFGGRGKMTGTLLGVVFIGVLTNGMVLLGANQYLQQVAQGLIILAAVLVSETLRGGGRWHHRSRHETETPVPNVVVNTADA